MTLNIRRLSQEEWRSALSAPILVITGAGLSADSGLQTFRGAGGLWRNYNPMSLATPEAFARDPKLVWEWYGWRRVEAIRAKPNAAHVALAELAARNRDCLIVTQNVDDLHERAQTPADQLIHVHGDLFLNRCTNCSYSDHHAISTDDLPPRCPGCQDSLLRPGVVWFGEMLDANILSRVDDFISRAECGLVLVVGTTATFHYIVDWALRGKRFGGILVEVNPEETELSDAADVVYRKRAAEVLPEVVSF